MIAPHIPSPIWKVTAKFLTCSHCGCFIVDRRKVKTPFGIWHTKCWKTYSAHLKKMTG